MAVGFVHSFESFGSVDGPGVRYVIFLQGCNMRCRYCHNPDTWKSGGEQWNSEELLKKAVRYRNYWKNNGGITVSGGEPMLQAEFLYEFFSLAKENGIHTTLDTSGQPFDENDEWQTKLLSVCDLVMLDLKEIDDEKHKKLTGHSNKNILALARWLSDRNKPMWIRHVLVPNLTDDDEGLIKLADFIKSLKSVEKVEVLPYHSLGAFKWDNLGLEYSLKDTSPPTAEAVEHAERILGCKSLV